MNVSARVSVGYQYKVTHECGNSGRVTISPSNFKPCIVAPALLLLNTNFRALIGSRGGRFLKLQIIDANKRSLCASPSVSLLFTANSVSSICRSILCVPAIRYFQFRLVAPDTLHFL